MLLKRRGHRNNVDEAAAIQAMLTDAGGVSEAHTVDDEALEALAASASAPPSE